MITQPVFTCDGHQFRHQVRTKYLRFPVTTCPCQRTTAHHAIDMNVPIGNQFGPSANVACNNQITLWSINTLTGKLAGISRRICADSFIPEYKEMYENNANAKDYLYQITKKQNFWPIRRAMEVFGDYLLTLYPCWLLSPENVSSILPLKKNLFDLVLFDEASQVFIENTVPAMIERLSSMLREW